MEETKPKTITLADGKEYNLPPIDLTTLANVEKTMGIGLGQLGTKVEKETVTTIRSLVYALLKENYPDIKIEEVGRLITLKEIRDISSTISEIMAISG